MVQNTRKKRQEDWHPSDKMKFWVLEELALAGRPARLKDLWTRCRHSMSWATYLKSIRDLEAGGSITRNRKSRKNVELQVNEKEPIAKQVVELIHNIASKQLAEIKRYQDHVDTILRAPQYKPRNASRRKRVFRLIAEAYVLSLSRALVDATVGDAINALGGETPPFIKDLGDDMTMKVLSMYTSLATKLLKVDEKEARRAFHDEFRELRVRALRTEAEALLESVKSRMSQSDRPTE